MLAHKAVYEERVAEEVIAGEQHDKRSLQHIFKLLGKLIAQSLREF
jgi:pyruvate/2-oxoglutarate dehydrogenase complex dihydrolipoamide dehydrogenase (E3) component